MSSSGTAGNSYAAELAAAKRAVTLAARLCQVPVRIVSAATDNQLTTTFRKLNAFSRKEKKEN
jgi:hypothetical protein